MSLVNSSAATKCSGCSEIKAECCTALGRHRQSREALEDSLGPFPNLASSTYGLPPRRDNNLEYLDIDFIRSRGPANGTDPSVLHCRAGFAALKSNLHTDAAAHFRQALSLNPLLWEAFEGLCSAGMTFDKQKNVITESL